MQPGRQRDWDRKNLPEEGRSSSEEDSDEDSDSRLWQRRQEALETGIGRAWYRKAERRREEAMKMQLWSSRDRKLWSSRDWDTTRLQEEAMKMKLWSSRGWDKTRLREEGRDDEKNTPTGSHRDWDRRRLREEGREIGTGTGTGTGSHADEARETRTGRHEDAARKLERRGRGREAMKP